jgi:hypothetical protein
MPPDDIQPMNEIKPALSGEEIARRLSKLQVRGVRNFVAYERALTTAAHTLAARIAALLPPEGHGK